MGRRRKTEKKKSATKGRAASSTAGSRVKRGSATKAFLKKVASRAGLLVKGKAAVSLGAKKKAKKSSAKKAAKKAVGRRAAKKTVKKAVGRRPAKKTVKKAVGRRTAKKTVKKAVGRRTAKKTVKKAVGRRTAKKTVKKAVGKRKTSRQVGRRAVSTSARKQGAPPVSSLRLVLEAVDPHRAVAYWEVPPRALTRAREHLGEAQPRAVLRVYEVSGLVFDGTNANESSDVVIDMGRGTHYLSFPSPGKILIAELGFSSQDGRFESLVRSNLVDLPRGAEAPLLEDRRQQVGGVSDPLWRRRWSVSVVSTGTALAAEAALASSDEEEESFDVPRAVRTGGVPPAAASVMSTQAMSPASLSIGTSSDFVSGISSVGFAGEAPVSASGRPARAPSQLDIQADIVIYGHARPETDLVIEGVPVHVRADGTFELRFTLGSVPWRDEPTSS